MHLLHVIRRESRRVGRPELVAIAVRRSSVQGGRIGRRLDPLMPTETVEVDATVGVGGTESAEPLGERAVLGFVG
jgi:hypothetical protein